MDDSIIELARCECCGLKEECTQGYINEVKVKFEGKWLCGLCSEAVRDEVERGRKNNNNYKQQPIGIGIDQIDDEIGMDEAVRAHMSFCRKYKANPAVRVADGMRQMLRRRSPADHVHEP